MAALVLTAALVTRLVLFGEGWWIATADSPSFLAIARDLQQGDLSDARLGTVRLPGYPLFLALIDSSFGWIPQRIVAAQSLLGVGIALAGGLLALRLGTPVLALAVGLTLALHPALIIFEHALMSETVGLALAIASVALLVSAARSASIVVASAAGLVGAAAMLTRLNLLPLLLVGPILAEHVRRRSGPSTKAASGSIGLFTAVAAGYLVLLLPWLAIMRSMQGSASIFPGGEKLRLANAIELGLVSAHDAEVELGAVDERALSRGSAYLKKLTLGPGTGEAEARAVLARALRREPARFAHAAARCALAALGWLPATTLRDANDLGAWLGEAERAARGGGSVAYHRVLELVGDEGGNMHAPPAVAALRWASSGQIAQLRGVFLAVGLALLIAALRRRPISAARLALPAALAAIVIMSTVLFALSFAMRQRFAFPLDWVAVALPVAAGSALRGTAMRRRVT